MRLLFSTVFFSLAVCACSQQVPQKYFVAFTDKNGTPYNINNPQAFLTQRAIDRRTAQGIPVVEEDLPVNPAYVNAVVATGVQVFTRSKWFNGVTVRAVDSSVLGAIRSLPFVQSVTRVTAYNSKKSPENKPKSRIEPSPGMTGKEAIPTFAPASFNYGPSYTQIHQLNGDALHNLGYRGQGKVIAVLDMGFLNVDLNPDFDSLWAGNQILGTRDFVTPGANVFREDNHGAAVLSIMAGDSPGDLIGTAPKASYWLFVTEDVTSENIVEEYNWEAGAEVADSVGADIIASSLEYTTFDNNWMDHTCADMNGHTNPSTRGANIAASKGIAVCICAGNSGGSSWKCVGSPSDAQDAFSVGAVDANGIYAPFSATGTVNGGYVKPDLVAMGVNCRVASPDNSFGYSSGTSFSNPVNAGLMACLWQAWPAVDQYHLRLVIERSASQYTAPDSLLGYGIPDYAKALLILSAGSPANALLQAYPNPFLNSLTLSLDKKMTGSVDVSLVSVTGNTVFSTHRTILPGGNTLILNNLNGLAPGIYILRIASGNVCAFLHVVKVEK